MLKALFKHMVRRSDRPATIDDCLWNNTTSSASTSSPKPKLYRLPKEAKAAASASKKPPPKRCQAWQAQGASAAPNHQAPPGWEELVRVYGSSVDPRRVRFDLSLNTITEIAPREITRDERFLEFRRDRLPPSISNSPKIRSAELNHKMTRP